MRRRLSRLAGELADPGTAGTLPLLLAKLEPRLTGETRLLLRLERLGNEPDAGGEDWAGGDWPVDGTEGYDGRLRVVGEPIVWLRSGGKSGDETSSGPLGRPGR